MTGASNRLAGERLRGLIITIAAKRSNPFPRQPKVLPLGYKGLEHP